MKKIVSISIGSSKRDHQAEIQVEGEVYQIQRLGTNGSLDRAIQLIRSLDGHVDAFGMGGIDLYLWGGKRRYVIREALQLKNAAKKTPIVDGSGLKNTLERRVISYLQEEKIIDFQKKNILITSAMDRFGMAEMLKKTGGNLIIGDLIFGLGVNIPLYSLEQLHLLSRVLAPVVCKLPFKWLYPTGEKQNYNIKGKFEVYYNQAEIIAGDYHYIKRYMPYNMKDKIVITNTITEVDLVELKERGVELVVTTTPEISGRSFGTNVIEALLVAILRDRGEAELPPNYDGLIEVLKLSPRIEYLQQKLKDNSNKEITNKSYEN